MSIVLAAVLGIGLGLLPWRLSLGITFAAMVVMLVTFRGFPDTALAATLAPLFFHGLQMSPVLILGWVATLGLRRGLAWRRETG